MHGCRLSLIDQKDGGFFRHTFYDTGDSSCLAFFDLHGVGEEDDWDSAISTGNGLPSTSADLISCAPPARAEVCSACA